MKIVCRLCDAWSLQTTDITEVLSLRYFTRQLPSDAACLQSSGFHLKLTPWKRNNKSSLTFSGPHRNVYAFTEPKVGYKCLVMFEGLTNAKFTSSARFWRKWCESNILLIIVKDNNVFHVFSGGKWREEKMRSWDVGLTFGVMRCGAGMLWLSSSLKLTVGCGGESSGTLPHLLLWFLHLAWRYQRVCCRLPLLVFATCLIVLPFGLFLPQPL